MNKHEEIFIILKRIPEQADYIDNLNKDFDSLVSRFKGNRFVIIVKERKRYKEVLDSAEGVLFNLIERLNELTNGETNNN